MENFKAMENMKRLETLCIAGAVAVLAVSCGKEEAVREDGASKVGFTAAELQVKTVFGKKADGEYPVLWTTKEKVALFYNSQTGDQGWTNGGQYVAIRQLTGIPPDSPHHSLMTEVEATVSTP